ncbi:glycosyltransferase family 1 protein [Halonotius terrestris]|uniref:Glycosyltransferase family 1 protein n=1 Tax=Halonotius terrestris TaxID=2487750 RepID=A0A8J8P7K8_9EURY|nr:glycosyltransferase family 4 protein [Halonotius terrestris]TQQ81115.1 glycosyltransferase family 1 protein [Halonotius terrestris]
MSDPIFLYNDPHPVHERMANEIGAEFVECSKGGPLDRLRSGISHDFGNRPVLIEGGVPLLEAGFLGIVDKSGAIIELAADGSLIDIADPISGRPFHERLAHRFGERYVDGTLAVSDYLAAYARQYDRPVEVIHPFVESERYGRLHSLEPGGDEETILCIGKYRRKNGQDVLRKAMESLDQNLTAHFVGPDTENIAETEEVKPHGFVELEKFYDLMEQAELIVYPAHVGAYPVAVLEALLSGTPVLTSQYVGNVDLVRAVHPEFVTEPIPSSVAERIKSVRRRNLAADGQRAKVIAEQFTDECYTLDFEKRFNEVLARIRENQR